MDVTLLLADWAEVVSGKLSCPERPSHKAPESVFALPIHVWHGAILRYPRLPRSDVGLSSHTSRCSALHPDPPPDAAERPATVESGWTTPGAGGPAPDLPTEGIVR